MNKTQMAFPIFPVVMSSKQRGEQTQFVVSGVFCRPKIWKGPTASDAFPTAVCKKRYPPAFLMLKRKIAKRLGLTVPELAHQTFWLPHACRLEDNNKQQK